MYQFALSACATLPWACGRLLWGCARLVWVCGRLSTLEGCFGHVDGTVPLLMYSVLCRCTQGSEDPFIHSEWTHCSFFFVTYWWVSGGMERLPCSLVYFESRHKHCYQFFLYSTCLPATLWFILVHCLGSGKSTVSFIKEKNL